MNEKPDSVVLLTALNAMLRDIGLSDLEDLKARAHAMAPFVAPSLSADEIDDVVAQTVNQPGGLRELHDEVLVPGVDLLESMRSVGYSFESALSDIIDNSITAGARNVEIVVEPIRAEFVTIFDDGFGMGPAEARDALRLAGTRSAERSEADLGRFGLG